MLYKVIMEAMLDGKICRFESCSYQRKQPLTVKQMLDKLPISKDQLSRIDNPQPVETSNFLIKLSNGQYYLNGDESKTALAQQ